MYEYEGPVVPGEEPVDQAAPAGDDAARDDGIGAVETDADTVGEVGTRPAFAVGTRPEIPRRDDAPDIGGLLESVSGQVGELKHAFDERLRYDASKEESFQQLYRDLEEFRALAGAAQQRPVLMDIILLLDRVEKGAEAQPDDEFIESIRDELSEILARRGVSAMHAAEDRFDPQRQQAVGTRPAPDQAAHNTVAEVARTGYECDGQILRAAEVIVFRYAPAGAVDGGGGSS